MEDPESKFKIIEILKKLVFDQMNDIEVYESCKLISKWRFQSKLDPYDSVFDTFVSTDSELDAFPTELPKFASESAYLENCRKTIREYIRERKPEIVESSKKLLKKLESSHSYD